jgi:hypothetical protein
MLDSELVVIGGEAATRLAEATVVPDAGGQSEQALSDAGEDAPDGASPVTLERELTLEPTIDSIHWRMPPSEPKRARSSRRSGRTKRAPSEPTTCSNSSPAKPLSPTTTSPPESVRSSSASATSRSGSLAGAGQNETGIPWGVHTS